MFDQAEHRTDWMSFLLATSIISNFTHIGNLCGPATA